MSDGMTEARRNRRRGEVTDPCPVYGCKESWKTHIHDGTLGTKIYYKQLGAPLELSAANAGIKQEEAAKYDEGKPKLSMVSRELMEQLAKVREFGATKYTRNDWMKGFKYTRSIDAALRHLMAINSGENIDKESGCYHAACVIANMEHLLHDMLYRPHNDDRGT